MLRIENILVPVDFDGASGRAMTYATALAQDYGARLDLLHVLPPTAPSMDACGTRDVPFQQLQAFAVKAADAHIEVRSEIRTGNVEEEIARAIQANRAQLLVMGTHGRHGFKRWLRFCHGAYASTHFCTSFDRRRGPEARGPRASLHSPPPRRNRFFRRGQLRR